MDAPEESVNTVQISDFWDPLYDSFDVDLIMKVLAHTLFSPFFTFFVPIFYIFHGAGLTDAVVVVPALFNLSLCAFWFLKWYSRLYRNQGSLLFGPPRLDWGDELVVITGGSSGIGELVANTLAVRHVCVVVLDVNPIITENNNITYYKCDVSKWEDVERVSKQVVEELGHPTMLINNAGVVQGKPILDLSPEDVQQTFSVNTLAHFWTLKAFLPEMIKNGKGHIVNVSSVAGMVGMARLTDYGASKAALVSLHESLRYELDHVYNARGVRTTLLITGHIMTPLFSSVRHPKSLFYKFFFPSMAPVDVAKNIIAALDEQHSRVLYMPFYAHFVPLLHIMPSYIRDLAQWLTQCDYSMKDFVKVSGRRPEEGPAPVVPTLRGKSD
ncbi:retinal short-chain dehydrogenase/reductase [Epithele typhae]|uniref:retinal short-chain dehydrogenase/reductase n=1 Tax=Epithele typhae TaxID=378194 RepID=UPI00200896C0|nr:retinal short-chain dehydrogenase/reductase [Epithele typhae]KAH9943291.1 retinal short-chain dehydrogenase/reductase [Epithele typhae]